MKRFFLLLVFFSLCSGFLYSTETALLKEFTDVPTLNFLHELQRHLFKGGTWDKVILDQLRCNVTLQDIRESRKARDPEEFKRQLLNGAGPSDFGEEALDCFVVRNDYETVMFALRHGFRLKDETLPFCTESADMANLLLLSLKYKDPVLLEWMVVEDKKRREEAKLKQVELVLTFNRNYSRLIESIIRPSSLKELLAWRAKCRTRSVVTSKEDDTLSCILRSCHVIRLIAQTGLDENVT